MLPHLIKNSPSPQSVHWFPAASPARSPKAGLPVGARDSGSHCSNAGTVCKFELSVPDQHRSATGGIAGKEDGGTTDADSELEELPDMKFCAVGKELTSTDFCIICEKIWVNVKDFHDPKCEECWWECWARASPWNFPSSPETADHV